MCSALRSRARPTLLWIVATAVLASACGGPTSPTGPRQIVTPLPSDPTPPNEAPIIDSLTAASPRVEADAEVALTAAVHDTDTPVDQLSYGWSATPVNGEFTGTGRDVRWRAPRLQKTPDLYTLTLLVTEKYTSAGQPAENKVSKTVQVRYNDSPSEITRIGVRFLTELFADFSVSPQAAVQDFSDSCPGKASELSDVTNNRINFQILSGTYTNVSVNVDGAKTSAGVSGFCTFVDIPQDPNNKNYGRRESISGICTLTAVYENWKWQLCDSHFGNSTGPVLLGTERYRVRGHVVLP
jgi:hypothetical protein